jgi:uncharacterized protein YjbJ (UPF0337 family)
MTQPAQAKFGTVFQKDQGNGRMNRTIFEGKWKQIRGKSKEWWSLINDLDLSRIDKATEKLERYVVLLQVKYGYTKQFAREEINKRVLEEDAGEVGKTVLAQ